MTIEEQISEAIQKAVSELLLHEAPQFLLNNDPRIVATIKAALEPFEFYFQERAKIIVQTEMNIRNNPEFLRQRKAIPINIWWRDF
jgi:hypothetical protein